MIVAFKLRSLSTVSLTSIRFKIRQIDCLASSLQGYKDPCKDLTHSIQHSSATTQLSAQVARHELVGVQTAATIRHQLAHQHVCWRTTSHDLDGLYQRVTLFRNTSDTKFFKQETTPFPPPSPQISLCHRGSNLSQEQKQLFEPISLRNTKHIDAVKALNAAIQKNIFFP